jgi:hypothetical protein
VCTTFFFRKKNKIFYFPPVGGWSVRVRRGQGRTASMGANHLWVWLYIAKKKKTLIVFKKKNTKINVKAPENLQSRYVHRERLERRQSHPSCQWHSSIIIDPTTTTYCVSAIPYRAAPYILLCVHIYTTRPFLCARIREESKGSSSSRYM